MQSLVPRLRLSGLAGPNHFSSITSASIDLTHDVPSARFAVLSNAQDCARPGHCCPSDFSKQAPSDGMPAFIVHPHGAYNQSGGVHESLATISDTRFFSDDVALVLKADSGRQG